MNAKVLRVLEYDKVIHMLEQKATSDPGRQLCRDLVPMTDLAQIEQAQTETADALTRIFQKGSLNFGSNKPLGMCLRSLEIGSTLSSEELLRIAGLLENTARRQGRRTAGFPDRIFSLSRTPRTPFQRNSPLHHRCG